MFVYLYFIVFLTYVVSQSSPEGEAPEIADSCYPLVGCFSNFPPWTSDSRPSLPPQHPSNISETVKLFNRENPNGLELVVYPELDFKNFTYENRSIFFIYHGYTSNNSAPWIQNLTKEIINKFDGDIFLPEYNYLGKSPYEQALGDIRVIAKLSALLIEGIGVDVRNVHLIGHSIGAHIASYVANAMSDSGEKIGRITGLEPARQFYEGQPTEVRLDKEDALFVDIWHTNAGGIGILTPCGHADYFINGGMEQLFCKNHSSPNECNHQIVSDIFIEALKDDCLVGQKAQYTSSKQAKTSVVSINKTDYVPIGIKKNISAGVYFISTNFMPPFCTEFNESIKFGLF